MRTLILPDGEAPRARGRRHGETFRGEIISLAAIRMHLCARISGFSDAELRDLAERHLPVLAGFDAALHEELVGIAEGAALSPAEIVVLNHYTDLRDLRPERAAAAPDFDGGCTMFYAHSPEGPVFAQTWDMHATAAPYVMMLHVDGAWVLSLTGCLGMAGLSRGGVGVGINNLTSTDAQIGVVWSALVRRMLQEPTAAGARDVVLTAPLGSGHHYFCADESEAFGIETSGQMRELVFEGAPVPYVHANHCHDPAVGAVSRVIATSTTHEREAAMRAELAAPVASARDAFTRLGSHEGYPASICSHGATPENPHGSSTCGGVAMDLRGRVIYAVAGFTHNVEPERFDFASGEP